MSQNPEVLALHSLSVNSGGATVQPIGATPFGAIEARAQERLRAYHADVLGRREFGGQAVRAWWDGQGPPHALERLLTCSIGDFGKHTAEAVHRLAGDIRAPASSGLIVFVRLVDGGARQLACFKLDLGRIEEVRWKSGQPPSSALTAVDVDNVLPHAKQLQKAAVYPGPDSAQVWVVDDQLTQVADYWMRFLGARANPGERQRLRKVIEATEYAFDRLDIPEADAQPAIARALALARSRDEATLPETFLKDAAAAADVSDEALRGHATDRLPAPRDAAYSITQLAVRQARTTYDVGGDVKLSGPRGVLEERVETVTENGARYLKVLVTSGPHVSHS